MDKGYFKVNRSIVEWYGFKSGNRLKLWILMLSLANHTDNKAIFNGKPIIIKRGTFITSRNSLSIYTGISQSYIEKLIKEFILEHQIGQVTSNISRLITITNYDIYQKERHVLEQPRGQQKDNGEDTANTLKTLNNIYIAKKETKSSELLSFYKDCFYKTFNKAYVPSYQKDYTILNNLLKDMTGDEIKDSIKSFFSTTNDFLKQAGYSIGVFKSQINKLRSAQSEQSSVPEFKG